MRALLLRAFRKHREFLTLRLLVDGELFATRA